MHCHTCNSEMDWGNIYLEGNSLRRLFGNKEQQLIFDSYNPNIESIKIIEWGQYAKGLYCNNCESVCISNKVSNNDCCTNCGVTMIEGDYCIAKFELGYTVSTLFTHSSTPSENHLYFSSEVNQISLKILKEGFFVRGFYCHECGTIWFERKRIKPY